jgi:hypothetical protein
MPIQPRKKKKRRLHESTAKSICRLAFLGLTFLPVVLVVMYGCCSWTPWYREYQRDLWQHRISSNLGVDVRFAKIDFPSPHSFCASEFTCLHPETGKEILRARLVEGVMDRSGWTVGLKSPELNGSQLQSALQVVHDWFLCRPQKSASLLKLSLPELTVYDAVSKAKFEDVEIGIKPTVETSAVYVKFSMEGHKFAVPSFLVVERNHALDAPLTKWELRSNEVAIPCRFVTSRFPALSSLGPQATFRGKIAWAQNDATWLASLQGDFDQVQFANLTSSLGSPIRGLAKLSIQQAEIVDSKIQQVQGSIQLTEPQNEGQINMDWLTSTRWDLQLLADKSLNQTADRPILPLQRLGLDFMLNSQGLSITGQIKPDVPGWPNIAMEVDGKCVCGTNRIVPLEQVSTWLVNHRNTRIGRDNLVADGSLDTASQVSSSERVYVDRQLSQFLDRVLPWSGSVANRSVVPASNRVAGRP